VLIEKPIGHALEGVAALLDEARNQRKALMVGYNLRFHPGLARLRELVCQGTIGKIVSARAEMGEYLPDWHPWEDHRLGYSARRDLGGGAVLTFSHELDALCWLLGAPRRVTAMAAPASCLEIDTEAVAELVLEFPGRALGSVHVDFVRRPPRRSIEVVGDKGVLRWDYEPNRLLRYAPATRQWLVEEGAPTFERNHMYMTELRHFVDCARGEVARPLIDGEQAAAILAISLAALRSSTEGRAVDLLAQGEPIATWLSSLGTP
jgi:predicted dehydrogenase